MNSNQIILATRQTIVREFKKYEAVLLPIIKFLLLFSAIRMLVGNTGYTGVLSETIFVGAMALIGAFVSAECIMLGFIGLVSWFVFSTNPILAIIIFVFLVFAYILFMRLFPTESIWIIVTLVAFSINMELVIPVVAALFGSYVCIIAITIGIIFWYVFPQLTLVIQSTAIGKSEILETISSLMDINYKDLLLDETMLAYAVIFFIVFTIIYIIRKQSVDYAPYIAIGVGAVMNILGFCLAMLFFESFDAGMLSVIIQTLFYGGVASIMQFFSIILDYQRAEVVSFEDDENYYFVKVVPKIKLTTSSSKVKKVYSTKPEEREEEKEEDDYTQYVLKSEDINRRI